MDKQQMLYHKEGSFWRSIHHVACISTGIVKSRIETTLSSHQQQIDLSPSSFKRLDRFSPAMTPPSFRMLPRQISVSLRLTGGF